MPCLDLQLKKLLDLPKSQQHESCLGSSQTPARWLLCSHSSLSLSSLWSSWCSLCTSLDQCHVPSPIRQFSFLNFECRPLCSGTPLCGVYHPKSLNDCEHIHKGTHLSLPLVCCTPNYGFIGFLPSLSLVFSNGLCCGPRFMRHKFGSYKSKESSSSL